MPHFTIGQNFDALVEQIKQTFKGFFDFISHVLNFCITVLEKTLLLDSHVIYASIIFGLVLAGLTGLLAKRARNAKWFIPVFLVTAVLFGVIDGWRVNVLSQEVTPAIAGKMQQNFQALAGSLQKSAPSDFSAANAALEGVSKALPPTDDRNNPNFDVIDSADSGIRDLRRAREGDFNRVYEALQNTTDAVTKAEIKLPQDVASALQKQNRRFYTLTLIRRSDRLIRDFKRVSENSHYRRMNAFVNDRTYTRLDNLLAATISYYGKEGQTGLVKEAKTARGDLHRLNPERLNWFAPLMLLIMLCLITYLVGNRGMIIFSIIGFFLIEAMGLWVPTIESLALVLSATLFALLIGIPLGILSARSQVAARIIRPVLDLMQTMPAFVYLIPAVIFFGLGKVPGAMATLIFSMPPAVRLTTLGIQQVPTEVVEAAQSFGATSQQLLLKVQLPIAMKTILAGVNQTIMLALSMVVIGGMIGAGGLGEVVLSGITQLKLGLGFEGGIAVVILAIYLDRVTQALGIPKPKIRK